MLLHCERVWKKVEIVFLIKSLAEPLTWILLSLVSGLVLTRFSRRKVWPKIGWLMIVLGTLLFALLSFPPFAGMLTYSLESRVPVPEADVLSTLDVIVVLGGGGLPSGGFRAEAELSRQAYPRLYHGVRLFKQGHAEVLAFCGGRMRQSQETEGQTMKDMAVRLGVPEDRILAETVSTNTMENAMELAGLLPGQSPRRIGVVTTAVHTLRSVRVFESQFPDDVVVPVPVNYRYDPHPWWLENLKPRVSSLDESVAAIHEWIGLLWYAVRY